MPKPEGDRPQPEPRPVRPPTLVTDFPDVSQNPISGRPDRIHTAGARSFDQIGQLSP
jgi:hypothetical protein